MVRSSAGREFHDAGPEKEKLALLTWCSAEVWCSCLSQRERVQAGVRHSGGSRLHDVGQITRIWGQDPPTQKGQFWGLFGPWKIIGSLCCGVCRKGIIHSPIIYCSDGDRLLQLTAVLPTGQCHITLSPPWKIRPLRCGLLSKLFDHLLNCDLFLLCLDNDC